MIPVMHASMTPSRFRKLVLDYYRAHGRDTLPWRKTRDPYRILVSEVMLQQTQVERVIPFYERFVIRFPDVRALSRAPLASVLREWQGLGYNRRARMLHEAAKAVVNEHKGVFPREVPAIESLPGVGPYTARAVAAFAYDTDSIFVETNIRTAVIHHFFPRKAVERTKSEDEKRIIYDTYSDSEIMAILGKARPSAENGASPREWNSALMDYGAALKRQGVRTNALVAGYAKQKRFDGSLRQARGAILRALSCGSEPTEKLTRLLGDEREAQMKGALASLTKEGLVELRRGRFRLPGDRRSVSSRRHRARVRR